MRANVAAYGLMIGAASLLGGCGLLPGGTTSLSEPQRTQVRDYQQARRSPLKRASRPGRHTPAPPIPSPMTGDVLALRPSPEANPPKVENAAPAPRPADPEFSASTQPAAPQTPAAPDPAAVLTGPTTPANHDTRLTRRHLFGELTSARTVNASPLDDQGNLRRVTFTTEGADFDVEVDPTGQWLAYASTRHRRTADIYLQRVNGTAVTQLTTDPARDEMPCISPDGKQVAFASDRGGTFDLYLMDIAGGPAIRLTDDGAQNIHPSFSPDGRQIVYCSLGSQSGVWELVLIDVDRPAHRRIIGHGLFPVWSPTGNKIAYQRARERGSRWFSVWTIEVTDEGEAMRPTEVAASANAAVITPEWSADGRNLVFCTVLDPTADSPAGSRADIWICNADGTGRARLTHGRYGNLQPTWSADGSIYFVSNRGVDAIDNVYAVRPDQAVFLARSRQLREPDAVEATAPDPTPLPE
jgi:TolB protein